MNVILVDDPKSPSLNSGIRDNLKKVLLAGGHSFLETPDLQHAIMEIENENKSKPFSLVIIGDAVMRAAKLESASRIYKIEDKRVIVLSRSTDHEVIADAIRNGAELLSPGVNATKFFGAIIPH